MKTLTLYSDTFLWIKNLQGLLYNAANGNSYKFALTQRLKSLCSKLLDYDNLYSIAIDETDENLNDFIKKVAAGGFGILEDDATNRISLPPLLNIQRDYERLKTDESRSIGDSLLTYFSTLEVQLGGEYSGTDYHKQIIFPHKSDVVLPKTAFKFIEKAIFSEYVRNINVVCPDINTYPYLEELIATFSHKKEIVTFHVLLPEISDFGIYQTLLKEGYKIVFICRPDEGFANISQDCKTGVSYNFLITSEAQYAAHEEVSESEYLCNHSCVPVFDNNLKFFRENIFLDEQDILSSKLTKQQIFTHQAINTHFFGGLKIDVDGKIYSNYNSPALGTVQNDLYDVITTEMDKNYAWRRVRNKRPCINCLNQWLCPSPSNYEIVIGTDNLCKI